MVLLRSRARGLQRFSSSMHASVMFRLAQKLALRGSCLVQYCDINFFSIYWRTIFLLARWDGPAEQDVSQQPFTVITGTQIAQPRHPGIVKDISQKLTILGIFRPSIKNHFRLQCVHDRCLSSCISVNSQR